MNLTKSNQWLTQEADLEYVPSGVINLIITNEGEGTVSVDWVKFVNASIDKDKEIEEDFSEVDVEIKEKFEEVIDKIKAEADSA